MAAQRLAVVTMRATPAVTALVPGASIFDRHQRPETFPCIIVGEGQAVGDDVDCVQASDVFMDFHVWTQEDGFVACKSIAGAVRKALRQLVGQQDGVNLSFNFQDSVFLRDTDREHSHGIVRFQIRAWEAA